MERRNQTMYREQFLDKEQIRSKNQEVKVWTAAGVPSFTKQAEIDGWRSGMPSFKSKAQKPDLVTPIEL